MLRSSISGASRVAASSLKPRLSVVVPAYNEGEAVVPFLDSLFGALQSPGGPRRLRLPGGHDRALSRGVRSQRASPGADQHVRARASRTRSGTASIARRQT